MKKWICNTCGYIIENEMPKTCPICESEKFNLIKKDKNLINDEIDIELTKETDDIIKELNDIFQKECLEVAMYLATSKIAYKEGYDKVGKTCEKIAYEEANHASVLIDMLGYMIKPSTEENLQDFVKGEYDAIQSKLKLVKKAKENGLDVVYNKLNKMCIEEANHGKIFSSLLNEYFVNK